MASKLNQPWIPPDRIEANVQLEPAMLIVGLVLAAGLVYKLLLRRMSPERHHNIRKLFTNLLIHLAFGALLFTAYWSIQRAADVPVTLDRISVYIGLLTLVWGAVVFVKSCRILVFEYLFLGHMKEGVPVILVNLFTLLLSMLVGGWLVSEIFDVRLGPILATSAIFSVVLGLALQDTLGNVFAGIALQLDKSYEIGDWIEVQSGPMKWWGQVHEVTWRATVLIGPSDEALTIPNRVMAQAEVSNYSPRLRPIVRSQIFKIPYGTDIERTRSALQGCLKGLSKVRETPAPFVFLSESNESWIAFKLVYFIDDYASQFSAADQVITRAIGALSALGVDIASQRIQVIRGGEEEERAG